MLSPFKTNEIIVNQYNFGFQQLFAVLFIVLFTCYCYQEVGKLVNFLMVITILL